MTYIQKLRAALKEKSGALDAIITKADAEGRELNADEVASIEAIEVEVGNIEKSIELAEKQEQRKAKDALPSDTGTDDLNTGVQRTVPAQAKRDLTQIQKMGLTAMSVAAAEFSKRNGENEHALKILSDSGFDAFAKDIEATRNRKKALMQQMKTMNSSVNISGGFLTPDNQSRDIIELLYPMTTFLQGGPRIVSMPNGVYRQPKGATGASASYRQEGGPNQATKQTFEEVSLSAKFLGAMVLMTQEMIDFSIAGAEAFVQGDLREAMSQTMDVKAYYGTGSQGEPLGLFNHTGIQTVAATNAATPTLLNIDTDMDALELAFLNNNIPMGNWRYVMAPRTKKFIGSRRVGDAANGEFAFPSIRGANPTWGEHPVLSSTNFPINNGAGGDETDLALINFSDVLLGLMDDLAFATSSEATVYVNGAWISTFQNNLVALRALNGHDIGLRRPISVVKLTGATADTGITWGA